jgi:hypothetical protein
MRYQVTKLDQRHSHSGYFKYMLEFSKSTWIGTGVLEFDRARRWMNQTWGWSQEVETRATMQVRSNEPGYNAEEINLHWAYSVLYKDYRIYLHSDKELAWFQLIHAQDNN